MVDGQGVSGSRKVRFHPDLPPHQPTGREEREFLPAGWWGEGYGWLTLPSVFPTPLQSKPGIKIRVKLLDPRLRIVGVVGTLKGRLELTFLSHHHSSLISSF